MDISKELFMNAMQEGKRLSNSTDYNIKQKLAFSNDKFEFLDTVIKLYTELNMPMPEIFQDYLMLDGEDVLKFKIHFNTGLLS